MKTSIIVNPDVWIDFDKVAKSQKTDRATLLRNFMEQQVRALQAA